jgi:hypothetical protein
LRHAKRLMLLGAALVVLAAVGYYTLSLKAGAGSAERFVHGVLLAQYTRPIPSDARQQLLAAYDPASDEVRTELARILADLDNDQKAMVDQKAAYRDSKVRVRFRTLEARGEELYAVVEVMADWYWGYDGKPTETPTQAYNLHEFRLVRHGVTWQVLLDRNMASTPKTQVRVTPLDWGK